MVKATEALIELRNLKKQTGITQSQLHNKDVVIQFYERGYKKYYKSDSLNSILLVNKNKEIDILDNLYKEEKRERKKEKTGKILTGVAVPVVAVLSFLLGWYLHQ